MDNLTHSLIGAALGQAGLKRKTGLAMPALIIAANLPDIDAPAALMGIESLAIRRGITHGPIALVLLPLLLAWGLAWWDRRQARLGKRPETRLPVRFGWLLALCYIGALTHPFFDWLNSYGIRLLEPFSSRWFYGDALFIIDPWIIGALGLGIWLGLPRERAGKPEWWGPARNSLIMLAVYLVVNLSISHLSLRFDGPAELVENPVFAKFWEREGLWRDNCNMKKVKCPWQYGSRTKDAKGDEFYQEIAPTNMSDPRIAAWAKHDPKAQAFLFWSRMPIAELHPDRIILRDQRFMDERVAGRFSVTLRPPR